MVDTSFEWLDEARPRRPTRRPSSSNGEAVTTLASAEVGGEDDVPRWRAISRDDQNGLSLDAGIGLRLAQSHTLVDTAADKVYTLEYVMTPRKRYSFWIDDEQADGLKMIKTRDGVLESEQIRRALDAWLKEKGATKPPVRKRPTRKRA